MDYDKLEKEFDRIFSLPLWQRPIEVAILGKTYRIPSPDIRRSFDIYSRKKYQEQREAQWKN